MTPDLDERTYDLLRLIRTHEPIGSIRLVELMQRHGYDIEDRTIRLVLSDLDEYGLTEKVPGMGRRLTARGHEAFETGNVTARLEEVRARIATLTSKVTYDPVEDIGELVAACCYLDAGDVDPALDLLTELSAHRLGPCPVAVVESYANEPRDVRLTLPSSITLDGVLLSKGISAELVTAGIAEYDGAVTTASHVDDAANSGGNLRQYVDVISGKGSSVDVVTLVIETGRTDVSAVIGGEQGRIVVDNREFPMTRYEEGRDLAVATREALGGVVDIHRPREDGQFPAGDLGWNFCSLTYGGIGETGLALLTERGLTDEWRTLYGTMARNEFEPATVAKVEWE